MYQVSRSVEGGSRFGSDVLVMHHRNAAMERTSHPFLLATESESCLLAHKLVYLQRLILRSDVRYCS